MGFSDENSRETASKIERKKMPKDVSGKVTGNDRRTPYPTGGDKGKGDGGDGGDKGIRGQASSPLDLTRHATQIKENLTREYDKIVASSDFKKYKWDSKILGQCLAKRERLENYIPPPDRKAVVIQQKGKLALDNRINRYQKKFVEGEYKDLQQQLVNYNASAEDYNRTRPDKNQEPFPCFELHQEIQERAKEAEKDQMDLLSEYNSIVRDYKPFVQKMKEAGEMIARIEQEIIAPGIEQEMARHGGGVLREGQESGESLDRNEQEQLEKTRRDEVDDLVRQIEPFEMAIQAYNRKVDDYNGDPSKEKKLLKLPEKEHWLREGFKSVEPDGVEVNPDTYDSSVYERFKEYETEEYETEEYETEEYE